MKLQMLPLAVGALVAASVSAPGSANVALRSVGGNLKAPTLPKPIYSPRLIRTSSNSSITFLQSQCSGTGQYSFIGGGQNNVAGSTATGVLVGYYNEACDDGSSVSGGYGNIVGGGYPGDDAPGGFASIASGYENSISGSEDGFIGGGESNLIVGAGGLGNPYRESSDSSILAGSGNVVSDAPTSMIGAGYGNVINPGAPPGGPSSFIGAGERNSISSNYSVIVGGYKNSTSGVYTSILGGFNNIASGPAGVVGGTVGGGYGNTASGQNSTIPGGASNVSSGLDSFAAGLNSHAVNPGAFVWSDEASGATTLSSNASNQFLARASGGFFLYSSAKLKSGVRLAPGSGSWSSLSDRASKTDVQSVDDSRVLSKVVSLPVSEWSYTEQGTGVRHLGPMAQDFRAAFGLGEDEKHISTIDEEGVALAAIKALAQRVESKDQQITEIHKVDDAKYASLERRLEAVERALRPAKS